MKKLFVFSFIFSLLYSLSFSQTSVSTRAAIDNNLINQGIRGISATKLKNSLTSIVDYVDTKVNSSMLTSLMPTSGGNFSGSIYVPNLVLRQNHENGVSEFYFDKFNDVLKINYSYNFSNGFISSIDYSNIFVIKGSNVGIGTDNPTSPLHVVGLPIYSSNSAAISGGLTAGAVYRSSTGFLMVVY